MEWFLLKDMETIPFKEQDNDYDYEGRKKEW
jgi:hypothetical protein